MRLVALLLTIGSAALALTATAVVALAHVIWAALPLTTRQTLVTLNWAMIGTMFLLLVVIPALMSTDDRKK